MHLRDILDSGAGTAATVVQIMSLHSQITRLAREVVGGEVNQLRNREFRSRDQLEDDSEDLAQEYIR